MRLGVILSWSLLNFGDYRGNTLPQVLFSDPDWFFEAIDKGTFSNKGNLHGEALELNQKARNIKIPPEHGQKLVAYFTHIPSMKLSHMELVSEPWRQKEGAAPVSCEKVIDMSTPRHMAEYDKLSYSSMLSFIKYILFGDAEVHMTKKRCEDFFDNPDNFKI
jgi:hypothetical protein